MNNDAHLCMSRLVQAGNDEQRETFGQNKQKLRVGVGAGGAEN